MLSYRYNRSHAIAGKVMRPVSFGGGGSHRHVRGPRCIAFDVRLVMIVLWAPDNVTLDNVTSCCSLILPIENINRLM